MKHFIKLALVAFVSLSIFSACEKDPEPSASGNKEETVTNALQNTKWAGAFSYNEEGDGLEISMRVKTEISFGESNGTLKMTIQQVLYNGRDITSVMRNGNPELFEPEVESLTYTYENGDGTMILTDIDDETGEAVTETVPFTVDGDKMSFTMDVSDITLTKQ